MTSQRILFRPFAKRTRPTKSVVPSSLPFFGLCPSGHVACAFRASDYLTMAAKVVKDGKNGEEDILLSLKSAFDFAKIAPSY